MRSDRNSVSTCPAGEERYEYFRVCSICQFMGQGPMRWEQRVQYDCRAPDGELFSCVAKTLEEARRRRDEWLRERGKGEADDAT